MKALFIGRFQPFHLGHLNAIKQITEDEMIIGIGSSQYNRTDDNFWSFEERKKMIYSALKKENMNYKIIAIPDIHDEKKWVDYVVNLVSNFNIVYSGNEWVVNLFKEKNYKTKKINFEINISGTELRQMIREKNEVWKKFIPKQNIDLIQITSSLSSRAKHE